MITPRKIVVYLRGSRRHLVNHKQDVEIVGPCVIELGVARPRWRQVTDGFVVAGSWTDAPQPGPVIDGVELVESRRLRDRR